MTAVGGSFDARTSAAARHLIVTGRITDVRVLQNGRVVTGVAHGGAGAAGTAPSHRVYIRYSTTREAAVDAECSCDEPSPCLHVAAVVLLAARQSGALSTDPTHTAARASTALARQALCYVLEDQAGACRLSLWVAHGPARDGEILSGAQAYVPRAVNGAGEYPRYVDPEDRSILNSLPGASTGPWELRGEGGCALLKRIVATMRALWRVPQGRPLRAGPARDLRLAWHVSATGEQRLECLDGPLQLLVGLAPAMYVDAGSHECGLVAAILPRPREITVERQPLTTLRGELLLSAEPAAVLFYLYNERRIDSRSLRDDVPARSFQDGVLVEIERDLDAECVLKTQLAAVMQNPPRTPDAWLTFLVAGVPALRDLGWAITIAADFPHRLARADDWYVDMSAAGVRQGWFDLQLGARVDGRPVNLLPALIEYLQGPLVTASLPSADPVFVALADGRHLPVPVERIRRIADTLVELFDRDALNERLTLTLPRSHAVRLAHWGAGMGTVHAHDPALADLVADFGSAAAIERLQPPPDCRATLRPYQQEGLGWLQRQRRHGLGGILADDMGLGKTLQTLAHLSTERAQGRLCKPVLIVAPVSVLGNWQREIRRFAPRLSALTLHGAGRRRLFAAVETFDILLVGYPSLLLDAEMLAAREYSFVILDEAQMIKNPRARVSQAARALRAEHRLCLTGTPMENHLGDLWSLLDFVQPGLLGTEREFARLFRAPIENGGDAVRAGALRRRIAPFLLRRTKDRVARELPSKTRIVESIVLDERQRDLYDGIRLSMHRRVRDTIEKQGMARSRITLLDALLKMRQACCDPRLLDAATAVPEIPSAKLGWLSTSLPALIADGRRILLFSQFTSMLRLIEDLVTSLSIPYCLLTGDTRDRPGVIDRFQSGGAPLFLLSLKAGGAGLNLTAADTVIHYDPWWNPAVEMQATDRAHRIGQDKPVFVYKLIAQDTVEERILELQADKRSLVSRLYDTGDAAAGARIADWEALFA